MSSLPMHAQAAKPRVLVLSRNYPSPAIELLGLWVRQIVQGSRAICDPLVVAPVPWAPRMRGVPEYYARFGRVPPTRDDDGVEVIHPRFLVGPGSKLSRFEPAAYYRGVKGTVARLHERFPFDLIHAHFTWPDGVVGARLAARYGVPLVITEQAPWRPWFDDDLRARGEALEAASRAAAHIAISNAVRASIEHFTGPSDRLHVVPDAVDGEAFRLRDPGTERRAGQILFVGIIRRVKGVDVLLRALHVLAAEGRDVSLKLIGEGHFRQYHQDQAELYRLIEELGIGERVEFMGKQPLGRLVSVIHESQVLVLPSRAESLGMVLVEALACGTPVVATRCGGPEDIVTDEVGKLVPVEDPDALADAIGEVIDQQGRYEPAKLRAYALASFGIDEVVSRHASIYERALAG
jgi:glycosyltransferase involved in cell wall biosynthesis